MTLGYNPTFHWTSDQLMICNSRQDVATAAVEKNLGWNEQRGTTTQCLSPLGGIVRLSIPTSSSCFDPNTTEGSLTTVLSSLATSTMSPLLFSGGLLATEIKANVFSMQLWYTGQRFWTRPSKSSPMRYMWSSNQLQFILLIRGHQVNLLNI